MRIRYKLDRRKPVVAWSRTCPRCRVPGVVGVKAAAFYTRFYFCRRGCGWAGWRPPAGVDCPKCGEAMLWSASRLSVGCDACKLRVMVRESGGRPPGELLGSNSPHFVG